MHTVDTIERIDAPVRMQPVTPRNHGGQAFVAVTADHRSWVVREALGVNQVLAEAMYFLLARSVDASVAHGAVFDDEGSPNWASLRVEPARHWTPREAAGVDNLAQLGAMLALDAVAGIQDRHEGNLLLTQRRGVTRAVVIDNANSFLGTAADIERAVEEASVPPLNRHLRGLPLPSLERSALETARRLTFLPAERVAAIVGEACDVTAEPAVTRIRNALLRRLTLAVRLTAEHVDGLRKLP